MNEWTPQLAATFNYWIKTQDEQTWFDSIQPFLKRCSLASISRYGGTSHRYIEKNDLIAELITQVSTALLKYYDDRKSSIITYIHILMRNYIQRGHTINTYSKRDYNKHSYLEDIEPTERAKWFLDTPRYDYYEDSVFIQFLCDWWKTNVNNVFSSKSNTVAIVLTIIDIIENPNKYSPRKTKCKRAYNYTGYIVEKHRVSRQRVNQIYHLMRKQSPIIKTLYNHGSLLNKILG